MICFPSTFCNTKYDQDLRVCQCSFRSVWFLPLTQLPINILCLFRNLPSNIRFDFCVYCWLYNNRAKNNSLWESNGFFWPQFRFCSICWRNYFQAVWSSDIILDSCSHYWSQFAVYCIFCSWIASRIEKEGDLFFFFKSLVQLNSYLFHFIFSSFLLIFIFLTCGSLYFLATIRSAFM